MDYFEWALIQLHPKKPLDLFYCGVIDLPLSEQSNLLIPPLFLQSGASSAPDHEEV